MNIINGSFILKHQIFKNIFCSPISNLHINVVHPKSEDITIAVKFRLHMLITLYTLYFWSVEALPACFFFHTLKSETIFEYEYLIKYPQ